MADPQTADEPLTLAGEHSFRLRQDGMIVAEVFGPDRQQCFREIMHYALVYGQDGPCTVEGVEPSDWEAWGPLAEAGER